MEGFKLGKSSSVDNTMYSISNAFMLNELLPKNAVELPDISELEWSYNNIKVFDNMLTFWDLMDEPRYWLCKFCLLYTSDAADERSSVDLGGRRIINKIKKKNKRGRSQ